MRKIFILVIVVVTAAMTGLVFNLSTGNLGTVSANSSVAPPQNPDPADYQVAFYENINYGGHYMLVTYDRDYSDLRSLYLENDPKQNWNDRISSMKIGKNVCVTVWKDITFKGSKTAFAANGQTMKSYSDLRTVGWHDNISSFKVRMYDNCSTK